MKIGIEVEISIVIKMDKGIVVQIKAAEAGYRISLCQMDRD
ncbi:MAG: hypothetical protein ACLU5E_08750 [Anaerovoracaceae bacterium]